MLINSLLRLKRTVFNKLRGEEMVDYGDRSFQLPSSFTYRSVRVNKDYIARPDKTSYDIYGVDMYGDILCKLNGIANPFELNEDDILIIPSPEYIMEFMYYNPLQAEEESIEKPKKTKKTKRKSSDSIVSDSRFKIDNTKRIVVY